MSLASLLAQDTVTVKMPAIASDASGGATHTPGTTRYSNVPARVQENGSNQLDAFAQRQISRSYTVFTQQSGILNGDWLVTSDSVLIRVTGIQLNRAIGGMEAFYEIQGESVDG